MTFIFSEHRTLDIPFNQTCHEIALNVLIKKVYLLRSIIVAYMVALFFSNCKDAI